MKIDGQSSPLLIGLAAITMPHSKRPIHVNTFTCRFSALCTVQMSRWSGKVPTSSAYLLDGGHVLFLRLRSPPQLLPHGILLRADAQNQLLVFLIVIQQPKGGEIHSVRQWTMSWLQSVLPMEINMCGSFTEIWSKYLTWIFTPVIWTSTSMTSREGTKIQRFPLQNRIMAGT